MKKKLLFLLAAFALLVACDKKEAEGPSGGNEYLNVNSIDINGDQTSASLSVEASNNCEWVVTWSDAWIRSITPTKGRGSQSVSITVEANPSSMASRTAVIKVANVSGTITRNITITQSASTEFLDLSVYSMEFANAAESREVTITSNTHWTITGGANWIKLNKTAGDGNGTVTVSVDANTTSDERSTNFTFTGSNGVTKELSIKQTADPSGAVFSVTAPKISDIGNHEATVSFSFNLETQVTECGVCYGIEETGLTIGEMRRKATDSETNKSYGYVSLTWTSKQGAPVLQLTGLVTNTPYFVRVYTVSAYGTEYSSVVLFTTMSHYPGGEDNQTPDL